MYILMSDGRLGTTIFSRYRSLSLSLHTHISFKISIFSFIFTSIGLRPGLYANLFCAATASRLRETAVFQHRRTRT